MPAWTKSSLVKPAWVKPAFSRGGPPPPPPSKIPFRLEPVKATQVGYTAFGMVGTANQAFIVDSGNTVHAWDMLTGTETTAKRQTASLQGRDACILNNVLYTCATGTNGSPLSGAVEAWSLTDLTSLGVITWTVDATNPANISPWPMGLCVYESFYEQTPLLALAGGGGHGRPGGGLGVLNVSDPANMFLTGYLAENDHPGLTPHGVAQVSMDVLCSNYNTTNSASLVLCVDPAALEYRSDLQGTYPAGKYIWSVAAANADRPIGTLSAITTQTGSGLVSFTRDGNVMYADLRLTEIIPIPDEDLFTGASYDKPPTRIVKVSHNGKTYACLPNGNKGLAVFDITQDTPEYLGLTENTFQSCVGNAVFNAAQDRLLTCPAPYCTGTKYVEHFNVVWQ